MLAARLRRFTSGNAVVVVLSEEAIPGGCQIAAALALPIHFIACHEILCPGEHEHAIGSVSSRSAVIHATDHSLPQDFIYHQIRIGQTCSRHEEEKWRKVVPAQTITEKTVVVFSEAIPTVDHILAGIMEIRNQQPARIVVASPVISRSAFDELARQVNDVIVLQTEAHPDNKTSQVDHVPHQNRRKIQAI